MSVSNIIPHLSEKCYILYHTFVYLQNRDAPAIDRTQWRGKNVFVISLIWDKRGIPLYWQLLNKRGSSNIAQQQALISPVKELLKDYEIIFLGDA